VTKAVQDTVWTAMRSINLRPPINDEFSERLRPGDPLSDDLSGNLLWCRP
jgi:hypothetical protein